MITGSIVFIVLIPTLLVIRNTARISLENYYKNKRKDATYKTYSEMIHTFSFPMIFLISLIIGLLVCIGNL